MKELLHPDWRAELKAEFDKEYFLELEKFIEIEYSTKSIFPPKKLLFNAFNQTLPKDVRVVIIGQDPYHGKGQANGLSFSVDEKWTKIPPSLKNIYKELNADLSQNQRSNGDLSDWAKQGVLLLNATLSVEEKKPGSHQKKGWETFTNTVIEKLNEQQEPIVFLLWGKYAQDKGKLIDTNKHFVLKTTHPSPFSAYRGFLGSKHFSKTNEILVSLGKNNIKWN